MVRRRNIDDVMRTAPMGGEQGACAGMVLGYSEQTRALLNYGLHEDHFFETSNEFFGVWEAGQPEPELGSRPQATSQRSGPAQPDHGRS